MIQIKRFYGYSSENKINEFLRKDNIKFVDIKIITSYTDGLDEYDEKCRVKETDFYLMYETE